MVVNHYWNGFILEKEPFSIVEFRINALLAITLFLGPLTYNIL